MSSIITLDVSSKEFLVNNSEYVIISTERFHKTLNCIDKFYELTSDNGNVIIKDGKKVIGDAIYTSYGLKVTGGISIYSSNVLLKIVDLEEGNITYFEKKVFYNSNSFLVD